MYRLKNSNGQYLVGFDKSGKASFTMDSNNSLGISKDNLQHTVLFYESRTGEVPLVEQVV